MNSQWWGRRGGGRCLVGGRSELRVGEIQEWGGSWQYRGGSGREAVSGEIGKEGEAAGSASREFDGRWSRGGRSWEREVGRGEGAGRVGLDGKSGKMEMGEMEAFGGEDAAGRGNVGGDFLARAEVGVEPGEEDELGGCIGGRMGIRRNEDGWGGEDGSST